LNLLRACRFDHDYLKIKYVLLQSGVQPANLAVARLTLLRFVKDVFAFSRREGRKGFADLVPKAVDGPLGGFSQPHLELREGFLGRIEVELKHNGVRTRTKNRPEGWNLWLTFTISPVEATPAAPPRVVAK
jgi:hypothetical protein